MSMGGSSRRRTEVKNGWACMRACLTICMHVSGGQQQEAHRREERVGGGHAGDATRGAHTSHHHDSAPRRGAEVEAARVVGRSDHCGEREGDGRRAVRGPGTGREGGDGGRLEGREVERGGGGLIDGELLAVKRDGEGFGRRAAGDGAIRGAAEYL